MNFFYKFMKVQEDFFLNLMLRATPFSALNDPFDGHINIKQFSNANDEADSYQLDTMLTDAFGHIQGDFRDVGVMAFSEEHTSPAMWAYYADNHRGIVLEFDATQPLFQDSEKKLDGRKSRFGKCYLGNTYEFPKRVSYRREMDDLEKINSLASYDADYDPFLRLKKELFFIKSNDWIHEKELRAVLPLRQADSIICGINEYIQKIVKQDSKIVITQKSDSQIQITYPNRYEMDEPMGDKSLKDEIYNLSMISENNIHLFRINPQAITGIYCGIYCDRAKIIEYIEKNSELSHLKNNIYQMEVKQYTFQLRARRCPAF